MTEVRVQNARRRLALGISNVGFWVLTAVAGLIWFTPGQLSPLNWSGLFGVLLGAIAIQAVFDFAGGFLLMPRTVSGRLPFLIPWFRGMLTHCFLLCIAGGLNYGSFLLSKQFYLGVTVATLGLFLFRRQILCIASGARQNLSDCADAACWFAWSRDPAFTGGTFGMGRRAMILLPEPWKSQLSPSQLRTVVQRRLWEINNGLPARSLASALVWSLVGCGIGSYALNLPSRLPEHALFLEACWMTLWGFVGLLVLPSLSRSTVFSADQAAAASGNDAADWIRQVPAITGEDGSGHTLLQRVFYPIPSTEERLRHLSRMNTFPVLGNVARTNLYLSLATMTFLGRCVHCNAGRPELWIFPPSD